MKIKLFLSDCDGTLTDGIYQTSEKGIVSKSFFTRDFHGLWMLAHTGVKIGIITAASDEVITCQCRRGARYAEVIQRSKDKVEDIRIRYIDGGSLRQGLAPPRKQFQWDEIAFIGDDVFVCRDQLIDCFWMQDEVGVD